MHSNSFIYDAYLDTSQPAFGPQGGLCDPFMPSLGDAAE